MESGAFMKINLKGITEEKKYYSIPYSRELKNIPNYESAQKTFRSLLESSVQQRMIADVPLGTFFSILTTLGADAAGTILLADAEPSSA